MALNSEAAIFKNLALENFEFVSNVKLKNETTPGSSYGFYFKQADDAAVFLTIERDGATFFLQTHNLNETRRFALPDFFTPQEYTQFRFRCRIGRIHLLCEAFELGTIEIVPAPIRVGLYAKQANTAFDMARITAI
jgi:hypothetical protein